MLNHLYFSIDNHHKRHGQFGTIAQYPVPPTERIYCATLSQWPRNKVSNHFNIVTSGKTMMYIDRMILVLAIMSTIRKEHSQLQAINRLHLIPRLKD